MTENEQRAAQHLESLLAAWDKGTDDDKRDAVEVALSRLVMDSSQQKGSDVVSATETSEHLIRKSASIDTSAPDALYRINLALADAYQARRPYAPGTEQANEWTVLIDHLEDLHRQARSVLPSLYS